MAVEEDNKTRLADYGLSREFGHALDDLPDEKYNDKDITKNIMDVEAALIFYFQIEKIVSLQLLIFLWNRRWCCKSNGKKYFFCIWRSFLALNNDK